jgi:hypothetical protein
MRLDDHALCEPPRNNRKRESFSYFYKDIHVTSEPHLKLMTDEIKSAPLTSRDSDG